MKRSHKIILTVSIVLNLALVGVIAGHSVKKAKEMPWFELREKLTPETRDMMRNMFMEKLPVIRSNRAEMKKKKEGLEKIIGAPEFVEADFDSAMRDWKMLNDRITDGKTESFKTILKQLPQEERKKLAGHLIGVLTGNPGRGKGDKEAAKKFFKEQSDAGVNQSKDASATPSEEKKHSKSAD